MSNPVGWLSQMLQPVFKSFQWWVVVAPWERGVRVRLGKTAKDLHPGIHFRIPWLDRVYVQSVRLRTLTTSNQTISTKDLKVVTVSWGVQFAIDDIVLFYDSVANPEVTLRTLVASSVADFIATRDSYEVDPESVERAVNEQLREFREWGLGRLEHYLTSFAFVRTYRLMSNEYEQGTGLHNIDRYTQDGRSDGER